MSLVQGKARILFTGSADKLADNVIEIMEGEYQTAKCPPTAAELIQALEVFQPHLLVICPMEETREMLKNYDVLNGDEKLLSLPVILIGEQKECFQLKSLLLSKHLEIFARPLNKEEFLWTTDQFIVLSKRADLWSEAAGLKEAAKNKGDDGLGTMKDENNLKKKVRAMPAIGDKKIVLVVDDDVRMLNVIKMYLEDLFEVAVVPSGKLALKYLAKKPVDLVLLDYLMPEMDGPAVLQEIREKSVASDVPVIFLTGVADKDSVMRGLEFQPNGYLLKPIARELLIERVMEVLLGL